MIFFFFFKFMYDAGIVMKNYWLLAEKKNIIANKYDHWWNRKFNVKKSTLRTLKNI